MRHFLLLLFTISCFLWGFSFRSENRKEPLSPFNSKPIVDPLAVNASSKSLPNIVYIYADDLGYGELGSYGQTKIETPFLDKMAAEGMRFTQHYASTPVCAPSRCMLLTGKHGGKSYIRGNHELGGFGDDEERGQLPLADSVVTIAEMLKAKGYATAVIGKWGLGMNNTEGEPTRQGFDYYYGYLDQKQAHNYYPTHLWENGQWDSLHQPFLNVHQKFDALTATAQQFEQFTGKVYAPEKCTQKAIAFMEKNRHQPFFLYLPYTIPHVSLQAPAPWVEKYKGKFNEQPYWGEKGYTPNLYPKSTYATMISYLDAQVGLILAKLEELGLSFLPVLLGKKSSEHPYLYFEYPEKGGQLAIRMGKWKAIKTELRKNPQQNWQIFNLDTDPFERTDLAANYPDLQKTFEEIFKKEHQTGILPFWKFADKLMN